MNPRGKGRVLRRAALAAVALLAGLPLVGVGTAAATAPSPTTYQDDTYGSVSTPPTADKPQSKLWFNDGSWWALMLQSSTSRVDIAELRADHTWQDTGVVVDDRPTSTGDALWSGGTLTVASRVQSGAIRVNRFTYDPGTRTYARVAGFPVQVSKGGSESVTIDVDSTGRMWLTYTQSNKVWVSYTKTSPADWAKPFNPPVPDYTVTSDDISGLLSFGGKIGVLWSDQGAPAFRMAIHQDTDPVTQWTVEDALTGAGIADDHMNLKKLADDGQGRAYAVIKTSLGDNGGAATVPIVMLLVRSATGTWSSYVVATKADGWTRPQLAIDRTNHRLYVLATAPEAGGIVYYKTSDLDTISFAPGMGDPFLTWPGARINNVSLAKDPVDENTDLVALASDQYTRRYYHGELDIQASTPDTTAPTTPTGIQATPVSASEIDLSWSPSTDDVAVSGYSVTRDGVAIADVSGTTFSDTGLAPSTTYTYSVAARDPAGNWSAASDPVSATTGSATAQSIALRGVSFAANPTATTITITTPTGTQAGDVMLATVSSRGNPTLTAPAGWTLVRLDANPNVVRTATWWHVATASEPASYTFTISTSQAAAGAIAAYSGVDQVSPIDTSGGQINASSTAITAPSVTTSTATRLVGIFATAADALITAPSAMTNLGQAASNAGTYKVTVNVDDEALAGATTTGIRQALANKAAANNGVVIALRSAS